MLVRPVASSVAPARPVARAQGELAPAVSTDSATTGGSAACAGGPFVSGTVVTTGALAPAPVSAADASQASVTRACGTVVTATGLVVTGFGADGGTAGVVTTGAVAGTAGTVVGAAATTMSVRGTSRSQPTRMSAGSSNRCPSKVRPRLAVQSRRHCVGSP